ncbi:MAG: 1-acyl-sn-glycerol-3-phosphate acyltransferase [Burkholderiaceae bacterium]|jgi:1-acyl-sn-glycerol-3-phosphate acyltransferase|nr:1-acyl-sn-glycerol-3-phosphate acyltransferase [Burkholderiaceae bacterium]
MKTWTALAMLTRGGWHIWRGWRIIRTQFPGMTQNQRNATVQAWARQLLDIWGIALQTEGAPPPPQCGPLLLVANHISWLDILVLHAAGYCRFVAKADVKHWPVIGTMATRAGTLYIERESRRDAMRVVHHVAESLTQGDVVAVFPEGTTSDGSAVLPFHANFIQAAIATDAPALPLAIRYIDAATGAPSRAPAYVGDDTLAASIWRMLTAQKLRAIVHYGAPEKAAGRDRRAWAAHLRQKVQALL